MSHLVTYHKNPQAAILPEPKYSRIECRKVLKRHAGAKAEVARRVKRADGGRGTSTQLLSHWLKGRTTSRPVWDAACEVVEELLQAEMQAASEKAKLQAEKQAAIEKAKLQEQRQQQQSSTAEVA